MVCKKISYLLNKLGEEHKIGWIKLVKMTIEIEAKRYAKHKKQEKVTKKQHNRYMYIGKIVMNTD